MRRWPILAPLLALALALSACADEPPPPPEQAAPAPRPTAAPAAPAAEPGSWLIMIYGNADDEVLEQDIFTDLNEAELVGSSANVTIVAQLDRFKGAFGGDGNWTGTRRLLIGQDDDLGKIRSELIENLGEVNMADGQTLIDFATWAIASYPADHYALIMSDHGMGWPGGWNDPAPAEPGPDGLELTADGDLLLLSEIDAALGEIRAAAGVAQLDLIGFDACLMAHIEVAAAVAPHARVMVASQEVEPALGWAYASFLGELAAAPGMDAAALGEAIVSSYIDQDQRIVDDEARAVLVEENFGADGPEELAEVAAEFGRDITLGAYDSAALPGLLAALDGFVAALAEADQELVAEARTYAQSFEDAFDANSPSYIDLGHFAQIMAEESDSPELRAAAEELLAALAAVVIAERHGPERPGATGLSIYFPDSELYDSTLAGAEVYAAVADRFSAEARWDDFLNLHYYGAELGEAPAAGQDVLAPGASEISVAELSLSEERIGQGGTTVVSSEVTGERLGFVYSFTGYYDPEEDSILVADMDYIDAGLSREVGGVFYPDWGDEGGVEVEYEWEPVLYGIADGATVEFALFMPEDYGDTDEAVTYSVEGTYQFAGGGSRYAKLFFKEGELVKAVSFTGKDGAGAPRAFTPREGDSFTILHQVIRLNSDSGGEEEYVSEEGGTVTIGADGLTLEELTAPAGDYVLGLLAEDMDGNLYEAYATVTVDE